MEAEERLHLANLPVTEDDYFLLISAIFDVLTDNDKKPSLRFKEIVESARFLRKQRGYDRLIKTLVLLVRNLCKTFDVSHPFNIEIPGHQAFDNWYMKYIVTTEDEDLN